jgi:xanthine/CO dehydrogenase XdhC/CoxF family maturation factor
LETLFAADGRRPVTTHREIVGAISRAAADGDSVVLATVVLATVVRVTGSSYGGVGARTVIRTDGSTVGLVSSGCLEFGSRVIALFWL